MSQMSYRCFRRVGGDALVNWIAGQASPKAGFQDPTIRDLYLYPRPRKSVRAVAESVLGIQFTSADVRCLTPNLARQARSLR